MFSQGASIAYCGARKVDVARSNLLFLSTSPSLGPRIAERFSPRTAMVRVKADTHCLASGYGVSQTTEMSSGSST